MKRHLIFWTAIPFAYLALCIPVGIFITEGALHPARRLLIAQSATDVRATLQTLGASLEDESTTASDGVILHAWTIVPHDPNGDAVILLHGMSDNRLGMIGYATLLVHHGFSVLMPDARGHGASGGALATDGLLERDDIRGWFEWLNRRQRPHCIFGFAESMGAAQLLQALEVEPNFCAVAVESSFSKFREIAYDRMGQPFHIGPWIGRTLFRPVVESAFLYARWKYHLNMETVSPEDAVAQTHVPVLLIHGQDDSNIPVRHSRRIRSVNSNVVLWEVPKTDHCGAISSAPREFENHLVGWFLDHSQTPYQRDVAFQSTIKNQTIVNSSSTPPRPSSQNPPSPAP